MKKKIKKTLIELYVNDLEISVSRLQKLIDLLYIEGEEKATMEQTILMMSKLIKTLTSYTDLSDIKGLLDYDELLKRYEDNI